MDNSIFSELQQLSQLNKQTEIGDIRKELNELVQYFEERPEQDEMIRIFAEHVRNLKISTIKEAHGFMVVDDLLPNNIPQKFHNESLGFCSNGEFIFSGRFVYPVFDVHGDVAGFCGYEKFADDVPKYLDSQNYGYKAKRYSMYGMEKLPEYYNDNEIVLFTEGIVCCLACREHGIHALAMLGSNLSPYCLEIVRRFGKRAIVFMDADEAGNKLRKRLHYNAPDVRVAQSRIAKDIDDSRYVDETIFDEIKKLKNPFYRSPLIR